MWTIGDASIIPLPLAYTASTAFENGSFVAVAGGITNNGAVEKTYRKSTSGAGTSPARLPLSHFSVYFDSFSFRNTTP